jgi:hypothetical protein
MKNMFELMQGLCLVDECLGLVQIVSVSSIVFLCFEAFRKLPQFIKNFNPYSLRDSLLDLTPFFDRVSGIPELISLC